MPRRKRTATEVLASWVDTTSTPDGCHRFTGAHNSGGYGNLMAEGQVWAAHRLAWALAHGPIPEGMRVCHKCDQPDCCRVDHLFLGTAADNTADMVAKGRAAFGDRNGVRKHPERVARGDRNAQTKLDPDKVREIRRRVAAGESRRLVAASYGVCPATVRAAIERRTWQHVA